MIKRKFLAQIAATALAVGATPGLPSLAAGQTMPPMGGGYKDVIPIPVDDTTTKAIAGALFKPAGTGPFPVVVYMSQCAGLTYPSELVLERTAVDHLLARGVATLIVDPFTPRNEPEGVCANLNEKTLVQYATRGGNDAVAALKVIKAMPDIDPNRVFLQGYSLGAISSLFAVDPKTPGTHDAKIAGLIAYYPYCYDNVDPSVPTLALIRPEAALGAKAPGSGPRISDAGPGAAAAPDRRRRKERTRARASMWPANNDCSRHGEPPYEPRSPDAQWVNSQRRFSASATGSRPR